MASADVSKKLVRKISKVPYKVPAAYPDVDLHLIAVVRDYSC
jgi:hypothetical protein